MSFTYSYSFLDTFHNVCKRQARHKFILRDVETTYTQAGGIDAHKALEDRLKKGVPLPAELSKIEPIINSLRKPGLKLAVEIKLAVDANLKGVPFFNAAPRYRAVPDIVAYSDRSPAYLTIDWKTGKPRDNELQHKINAVLIFVHYPRAETITAANAYTKTGTLGDKYRFERVLLPEYVAELEALAQEIETETQWLPREGPLCGWCPVKSCSFNRDKEMK